MRPIRRISSRREQLGTLALNQTETVRRCAVLPGTSSPLAEPSTSVPSDFSSSAPSLSPVLRLHQQLQTCVFAIKGLVVATRNAARTTAGKYLVVVAREAPATTTPRLETLSRRFWSRQDNTATYYIKPAILISILVLSKRSFHFRNVLECRSPR
jgi:hypothetical protein